MRFLALPVLLLLALAGLAMPPAAAAAPEQPPCNGTVGGSQTFGPVTVFASPPCYTVSIDAMGCPLAGSWKDLARFGTVRVEAYTCDPPERASQQAQPCTCPPPPQPACRAADTAYPLAAFVRVAITSDCRVIVSLLEVVACAEPLDGTWVVTQGRVTVTSPCAPQLDPCDPPFSCYPTSSSAVLIPPYCRRVDYDSGSVHANVGQCDPQVLEVDLCRGTGPGVHYRTSEPVNWTADAAVSYCLPHMPPPEPAGAASSQCQPSDKTYPFSPAVEARLLVTPDCQTHVFAKVDAWDCPLFGEGYNPTLTAGRYTVWTWGCRGPPDGDEPTVGSSSSAAAGPGPLPDEACEARDLTPDRLQGPLWGYDCTLDVETACLGGSSGSTERDVAFVHVSLARCDGPDWD